MSNLGMWSILSWSHSRGVRGWFWGRLFWGYGLFLLMLKIDARRIHYLVPVPFYTRFTPDPMFQFWYVFQLVF